MGIGSGNYGCVKPAHAREWGHPRTCGTICSRSGRSSWNALSASSSQGPRAPPREASNPALMMTVPVSVSMRPSGSSGNSSLREGDERQRRSSAKPSV